MALVSAAFGIPIGPLGGFPHSFSRNSTIIDAVGESVSVIGKIKLQSGSSKTISAAGGGSISFTVESTLTFANAGTTLRIGIQGVSAGLEDGTYTVYGDTIGGSGSLSTTAICTIAMTSGTATINDGDTIAVVFEMTTRGGTDSVRPTRYGTATSYPYSTTDTGTGPSKATGGVAGVVIKFDDGTVATFCEHTIPSVISDFSFNSGSTPDEFAFIFQLPFTGTTNQLVAMIGEIDATEAGELILYSDPLGTPVAERTVSVDPDQISATGALTGIVVAQITEFQLDAGVKYAVAYRPTTTNPRAIQRRLIGHADWNLFHMLPGNVWGGERTNQTGAFTQSSTQFHTLGCFLNKIQDDGPTNSAIATAVWAYANRTLTS